MSLSGGLRCIFCPSDLSRSVIMVFWAAPGSVTRWRFCRRNSNKKYCKKQKRNLFCPNVPVAKQAIWIEWRFLTIVKENIKKPSSNHSTKKEENKSFWYSLCNLYDNSIVLTAGTPVSLPCTCWRVQQEFHCSCCARNETLAVSGWCYWILVCLL